MKFDHLPSSTRAALGFVGGIGLTIALAATPLAAATAPIPNNAPLEIKLDSTPIDRLAPSPNSYAPIVDKAKGSVVHIFTTKKVNMGESNMLNDPMFRFFFGDPDSFNQSPPQGQRGRRGLNQQQQQQGAQEKEVPAGVGSGVIISKDGYILTNNHVVEDMDGVKVKVPNDEKEYTATIVGNDPETDIALLKVDAKDLPAITLADSTQLQVGDRVFAIGNPFDVGQTVTSGIISATGRSDLGITKYENFIQTDASINPGNSGGALVDMEGRLIGVNSAILSRSGGSQGVGLAVPVNLAWTVVNSLASGTQISRGYLGVAIGEVGEDVAELYGLPHSSGAMVTDVVRDTPAFAAGLRPGDVITHVNGIQVNRAQHLTNLIGQQSPGTPTKLQVNRNGQNLDLEVKLGTRDEDALSALSGQQRGIPQNNMPVAGPDTEASGPLAGLIISDYDASRQGNQPRGFRNPPPADLKGAIITQVQPGSAAQAKGLGPNDVIVEIDHQPVANADEARKLAAEAKGKPLIRYWSASEGSYGFIVLG